VNADDLKKRTKRFALRILKLVSPFPIQSREGQLVDSWRGPAPPLARTIELHVEDDRKQNLLPSWESSSRKPMKVVFG